MELRHGITSKAIEGGAKRRIPLQVFAAALLASSIPMDYAAGSTMLMACGTKQTTTIAASICSANSKGSDEQIIENQVKAPIEKSSSELRKALGVDGSEDVVVSVALVIGSTGKAKIGDAWASVKRDKTYEQSSLEMSEIIKIAKLDGEINVQAPPPGVLCSPVVVVNLL